MMTRIRQGLGTIGLLACSLSTQAFYFDETNSYLGASRYFDYIDSNHLISFDLDLSLAGSRYDPISLSFSKEAGDGNTATFNASLWTDPDAAQGLQVVGLTLVNASFEAIGDVSEGTGLNTLVSSSSLNTVVIEVPSSSYDAVLIGAPTFLEQGLTNWSIDTSDLAVGEQFELVIAPLTEVPLPAAGWLMTLALASLLGVKQKA